MTKIDIISGFLGAGKTTLIKKLINEAYMAEFGQKWYVLFFYVLNFIMVFIDFCLYLRNRMLDKAREQDA